MSDITMYFRMKHEKNQWACSVVIPEEKHNEEFIRSQMHQVVDMEIRKLRKEEIIVPVWVEPEFTDEEIVMGDERFRF